MNNLHDFFDLYCISSLKKVKIPDDIVLMEKFERVLTARTLTIYQKTGNVAIRDAMKILRAGSEDIRKTEIKRMDTVIKKQMVKVYSKEDFKRMDRDISRFYIAQRELDVKKYNVTLPDDIETVTIKAKEPELVATFDIKDAEIVKGLQRQNNFAAQNFYNDLKAKHVTEALSETVKQVGLSRTKAGEILRKELSKAMGLTEGTVDVVVVPAKFSGTAADYYSGLSKTTFNRTQNFNRMNLFEKVGVEKYQIVAIIDKRTSDICTQMNGRIFPIQTGVKQMDQVLTATSPDQLKNIAGWRRDLSEFGVKTGKGPNNVKFNNTLASAGMALPPYHFRCRTQVRPIGL